jgi:hypothetical protein
VYLGRYNLAHMEDRSATFRLRFPLLQRLQRRLRGLGCRCFLLVLVNHKLLTNLSGSGSDSSSRSPRFGQNSWWTNRNGSLEGFFPCGSGQGSRPSRRQHSRVMSRARIRSLAAPSRRSHGVTRGNRYLNTYGLVGFLPAGASGSLLCSCEKVY